MNKIKNRQMLPVCNHCDFYLNLFYNKIQSLVCSFQEINALCCAF